MLLKNLRLALLNGSFAENASIEISGGKIVSTESASKADEVIDCSSLVAVPSFFNTHTHAGMHMFRGQFEEMELHDWLSRVMPQEEKLTKKDIYESSKEAIREMVSSGTTAFNDMYYHPEEVAEAAREMGIRCWVGGHSDGSLERAVKLAARLKEEWSGEELLNPNIGPHAIYTCSEETLVKSKEAADRLGLILHTHLSETRKEVYDCWKRTGKRPVEYLDSIGVLGENVVAAHCGWLTKNEIKLLGERGVKISHCPVSNMKLAVGGEMPLPELMERNLISLGTDGPASNNSLSMFDSMKFASLLHKHKRWDPMIAKAEQIFEMATTNGFRSFGIDNSIKKGNVADIVLLDKNKLKPFGKDRIVNHLVYASDPSAVSKVICNGELVFSDGLFKDEMP